jgi:hypothetical protein
MDSMKIDEKAWGEKVLLILGAEYEKNNQRTFEKQWLKKQSEMPELEITHGLIYLGQNGYIVNFKKMLPTLASYEKFGLTEKGIKLYNKLKS